MYEALKQNRSPHGVTLRSEREDLERQKQRDQQLLDNPATPQSIKYSVRLGHRTELLRIEELEKAIAAKHPKSRRID